MDKKVSKIWSRTDKAWYDELRNVARYKEVEFDKTIQAQLEIVFPEYIFVPYSKTIRPFGTTSGSDPDFALIRQDYKEWWIVEVETIGDNLRHVHKQISHFTNGDYNSAEQTDYMVRKNPALDYDRLLELTASDNPKVLVIVDDITSEWVEKLGEFNPTICVFKVFINKSGFEMYNISGDYPYIWEDSSFCNFSGRNLLELQNPDVLAPQVDKDIVSEVAEAESQSPIGVAVGEDVELGTAEPSAVTDSDAPNQLDSEVDIYQISFRGQLSEWRRIEDAGKTFLRPLRNHPLRATSEFVLKRATANKYIIEVV